MLIVLKFPPSKPSLIWRWHDLTPLHRKQQFIQMWTSQKAQGGTSQNLYYWENQTSIAHLCPAKNLSSRVQTSFKFQLIQIQFSINSPIIPYIIQYFFTSPFLGIHFLQFRNTWNLVRQLQKWAELLGLGEISQPFRPGSFSNGFNPSGFPCGGPQHQHLELKQNLGATRSTATVQNAPNK